MTFRGGKSRRFSASRAYTHITLESAAINHGRGLDVEPQFFARLPVDGEVFLLTSPLIEQFTESKVNSLTAAMARIAAPLNLTHRKTHPLGISDLAGTMFRVLDNVLRQSMIRGVVSVIRRGREGGTRR
jgi:hypothetical protein